MGPATWVISRGGGVLVYPLRRGRPCRHGRERVREDLDPDVINIGPEGVL